MWCQVQQPIWQDCTGRLCVWAGALIPARWLDQWGGIDVVPIMWLNSSALCSPGGSGCWQHMLFYLSELILHSSFQLLFSRAVWPCAAHGPGSGLADMHSPAALAAHATAAAVPSADSCFSHSSYSNPISSPGLQIFTMYFTMLVNIYCFFPFVYYIWWFFCFRHLKRTSCAKWWVAAVSQLPALCFQF